MKARAVSRPQQMAVLLALLLGFGALASADETDERRVRIGLRLFRTLLLADLELAAKADAQGHLPLLLLYRDDRAAAERFATELFPPDEDDPHGTIQNLPVRVEVSASPMPQTWQHPTPAAIFLLQPLAPSELERVIRYGIEHKIILFSPFEGHVERGVLAGITIEAKVRPYLNLRTLQASGLHIKAIFLKIAKQYE